MIDDKLFSFLEEREQMYNDCSKRTTDQNEVMLLTAQANAYKDVKTAILESYYIPN